MTPWLVHELRNLGLEVVCLDARHARAALEMQINKTDQADAMNAASAPAKCSGGASPVRDRSIPHKRARNTETLV